jgi:hypothetical protein
MDKERLGAINSAVESTKEHFMRTFRKENPLYRYIDRHVLEVEKWAIEIMKDFPQANKNVVLLSVWLHDIGILDRTKKDDHAVFAESEARRFLPKIGVDLETTEKVAHCVRAHRNKDVAPETLEAKILTAADSASHMTDINYIVHIRDDRLRDYVEGKIERDYRDIGLIPGLREKLAPLYVAWKELIKALPDP